AIPNSVLRGTRLGLRLPSRHLESDFLGVAIPASTESQEWLNGEELSACGLKSPSGRPQSSAGNRVDYGCLLLCGGHERLEQSRIGRAALAAPVPAIRNQLSCFRSRRRKRGTDKPEDSACLVTVVS